MAKIRKLKLESPQEIERVHRAWMDGDKNTDRHLAIVGGAYIENVLEVYLKSKLADKKLPDNRTVFKNLFDPNGPLSTFSAKTAVAFAAGLIPAELFDDLEIIRNVRNIFAHSIVDEDMRDISFNTPAVAKVLRKLSEGDEEDKKDDDAIGADLIDVYKLSPNGVRFVLAVMTCASKLSALKKLSREVMGIPDWS